MRAGDRPTLGHHELFGRSADVLRRVQAGETSWVTDVVALLRPLDQAAGSSVRAATIRGGFAARPRVRADVPTSVVLDDLRDDRRARRSKPRALDPTAAPRHRYRGRR